MTARLQSLAGEPLLAMVCDSTNAVVEGHSGPEGGLRAGLREAVEGCTGRVLVGAFSSNIARLATVARVAMDTGRRFGVLGPAMQRMLGFARHTGYWPADLPELVDARHLALLPPEEVLAACTGSQGEPTAVLARLATDSHRDLALDPGDTVIFSSRVIPSNEGAVERVQTRLSALGVRLVTDHDHLVHVSGHPARAELEQLYRWVRPPVAIPVHGTPRHLAANAAIARGCGVTWQLDARKRGRLPPETGGRRSRRRTHRASRHRAPGVARAWPGTGTRTSLGGHACPGALRAGAPDERRVNHRPRYGTRAECRYFSSRRTIPWH